MPDPKTKDMSNEALAKMLAQWFRHGQASFMSEELAEAARRLSALSPTPWAYLCHGQGDGWQERDKIVRDPETIREYRASPNWTLEPLYRGIESPARRGGKGEGRNIQDAYCAGLEAAAKHCFALGDALDQEALGYVFAEAIRLQRKEYLEQQRDDDHG